MAPSASVSFALAAFLLVVSSAASAATASASSSPFAYGTAVYTYGPLHCTPDSCDVVPSCNVAHWAKDIEEYNTSPGDKSADFNIVYAYGGDIEFWPGKTTPTACHAPASTDMHKCNVTVYFDKNNAKAANKYAETKGVDHIIALVDSRMDGWQQIKDYGDYDKCKFGDFYPNLTNLTDMSIDRLAQDTAKLYCEHDIVDGIQVDLEPYKAPYKKSLETFVKYTAKYMRDEDRSNGCRDDKHPAGRTVSYFTFAHNMATSFTSSLGANGYYVFSGYDLFPKNANGGFMYNTPDEFAERFRREIYFIYEMMKSGDGKFTLAMPLGASCHEYEQYIPMKGDGCGPACTSLTNTATMADYVQKTFDVLTDPDTTKYTNGLFCLDAASASQFLGISWWSYSYQMSYPPMKWFDNEFLPGSPSPDALALSRKLLPKLSDGKTTCVPHGTPVTPMPEPADDCSTGLVGKKVGCKCDADTEEGGNWQCNSWNCKAGVCAAKGA